VKTEAAQEENLCARTWEIFTRETKIKQERNKSALRKTKNLRRLTPKNSATTPNRVQGTHLLQKKSWQEEGTEHRARDLEKTWPTTVKIQARKGDMKPTETEQRAAKNESLTWKPAREPDESWRKIWDRGENSAKAYAVEISGGKNFSEENHSAKPKKSPRSRPCTKRKRTVPQLRNELIFS
jgi:hypothetical protein